MAIDPTQAAKLPAGLDPRGPYEKQLQLDRLKKRVDDAKAKRQEKKP